MAVIYKNIGETNFSYLFDVSLRISTTDQVAAQTPLQIGHARGSLSSTPVSVSAASFYEETINFGLLPVPRIPLSELQSSARTIEEHKTQTLLGEIVDRAFWQF